MVEGVDYAFSRPPISALISAGKVFACRYGGPGSSTKHLTLSEAQALSNAGIWIVANAEGAADGLLGGFNAGVSWARAAETHFRSCGMPPDRPIYLSVDFNVTSAQWPTVANALRGAASVLSASRVGVYGGRRAIEWARRDNVAAWFWQTYAWSGGVWVAGNHIEQYLNGVSIGGVGSVDLDRAHLSDFGQWTVGGNVLTPKELAIVSNAYQVLYEWTNEHDPVKWLTNLDTMQYLELPNLPLRRMMRVEAKIDHLIALVEQMGTNVPEVAAIIAAMREEFNQQLGEIEAEFAEQLTQIEDVVDTQLDQAFTGGADDDNSTAPSR